MELLQLPPELIYSNIFPFFKWNDLLKLRQVSKDLCRLVKTFVNREFGGIPSRIVTEVNSRNKTWNRITPFLDLAFSAPNFYMNNSTGSDFFQRNENLLKFMKLYGPQISHLRVNKYSLFLTNQEKSFYGSLKNLRTLQIDFVGLNEMHPRKSLWPRFLTSCWPRKRSNCIKVSVPKTFENLKVLTIGIGKPVNKKSLHSVSFKPLSSLNASFLQKCQNLEEVSLAVSNSGCITVELVLQFREIYRYVKQRALKFPNQPNLKVFDLQNCSTMTTDVVRKISPLFLELCREFAKHSVKVRNVPAGLFKAFHPHFHKAEHISAVVESMHGLHPVVLGMELPFLSSLTIVTLLQTSYKGGSLPYCTQWPEMIQLTLFVNTRNLWSCTRQGRRIASMRVEELFELLFGSRTQRTSLKHLRLQFAARMMDSLTSDPQSVPCPRVSAIVSSCPKIAKLEIVNWPDGDNLTFSRFWRGLECLEEVRLTKCRLLGDEGFIGEDENQPELLRLKNLSKLWLVDLDRMPLITNKSFQLVFRHMKLSEFVMYSEKPLKNITKEGILALLSGNFVNSIQKFPFGCCWSLRNMDREDMKRLQEKFG